MALFHIDSASVRERLTSSDSVCFSCGCKIARVTSTCWLIVLLTLLATFAYSSSYVLLNVCLSNVSLTSELRNDSGSNKNWVGSRETSLRIYFKDLSLLRSFSTSKTVMRCSRACDRSRTRVHDFGSLKRRFDLDGT